REKVGARERVKVTKFEEPGNPPKAVEPPKENAAEPPLRFNLLDALKARSEPLRFRLLDAATGAEIDVREFTVGIASPTDYLDVADPRFVPARPGEPNRLTVTVRPKG